MTTLNVHRLDLISGDPFSDRYRTSLVADLWQAEWVRFLVCYFSFEGYNALSPCLAQAMSHDQSRALVTLTCCCGIEGLQALWEETDRPVGKVRCFLPVGKDGPADAKLLHSKMAVIVKPGPTPGGRPRVVLYTGSHNWSAPGLRVPGVSAHCLNVESSIRIEADWDPRWLPEIRADNRVVGTNPVIDALDHMAQCFSLDSSTDLGDPAGHEDIESWLHYKCRKRGSEVSPGATSLIVTAGLLSGTVDATTAKRGGRVRRGSHARIPAVGETLFVQHFRHQGEEPDVFDTGATWAMFAWKTNQDLETAQQPWLLLCKPRLLGQQDIGDPTVQQARWLVYEPRHNHAKATKEAKASLPPPSSMQIRRPDADQGEELVVEHWCIAPVKRGVQTDQLSFRPPDRYVLLEVAAVRAPEADDAAATHGSWHPSALALHQGSNRIAKKGFVVHDKNGEPSQERADAMRREQERMFGVKATASGGPTGDPRILGNEVFGCSAPINRLLFPDAAIVSIQASTTASGRGAVLDVMLEPQAKRERIRRIQRLTAPGTPHLVQALDLDENILERLGWQTWQRK